jgi:RimJ/RimL family protein N-acetyltransferase
MKKFGFSKEGLLRKYAYIMYKGTWLDVFFYSLLKNEYLKNRRAV